MVRVLFLDTRRPAGGVKAMSESGPMTIVGLKLKLGAPPVEAYLKVAKRPEPSVPAMVRV